MNLSTLIFLSFGLVAVATAETCTPGHYKLREGVCRKCPVGTFQVNANKYACRPCPRGKIAAEKGSITCTACPELSVPSTHRDSCVCKPGSVSKRGECKLCKPGTYFTSRGRCESCSPGRFQPEAGQLDCLKCPAGSNSGYRDTECVVCDEGEAFSSHRGCVRCKAGEGFDKYSGCSKCRRNRYKPAAGNRPCLPCPIGTHSKVGARKCLPCPRGTILFKNGECGSCPAGSYFDDFSRKCRKCDFNEFMPHENVKTSCYDCSGKKFALRGSSKCVGCPKHKYLHKDGICKPCPSGSVFERYALRCRKCRVNEFTHGNSPYCETCGDGSYALPGSTTCFVCPENEALILRLKECGTCPPGRYYVRYSARCLKCYSGSIQPEAGISQGCESCPRGTTANKERTECIPGDR